MQNTVNKEVQKYLEKMFLNVRETNKGFRFNVEKLDKLDMSYLVDTPCTNNIIIRRSGTGLVIIVE